MMEVSPKWMHMALSYLRYQVNAGFTEVVLPDRQQPQEESSTLDAIRAELGECTRCRLHEKRQSIVFGEGNPSAQLMFVGEGPGDDEDKQGRPFVGKAGKLLTKMIQAMNLDRSEVYIANVVKCRPPGNRDPNSEEIDTCFRFLEAQIAAVKPSVIVALGKVATAALLGTNEPISRVRGRFHDRKGVQVMPTYHPSFLLREEPDRKHKGETWSDLKRVMGLLQIPAPRVGDQS